MLKLGNYRVNWRHFNPNKDRVIFDEFGRKYVREISAKEFFGTRCVIYSLERIDEEDDVKSIGIAKLHRYSTNVWDYEDNSPKGGYGYDIYNKEIGRKLSLEDALSRLDITKEERAQIWKEYNGRRKHLIDAIID